MPETAGCPLTPAQLDILAACIVLKTTDSQALARYLGRSDGTIRIQFSQIYARLGVDCRYAAIRMA
jgi:DNA-binding NarL/FixJ family response regulator